MRVSPCHRRNERSRSLIELLPSNATLARTIIATMICAVAGLLAVASVPARAAITHNYLSLPHITEVPSTGPHE